MYEYLNIAQSLCHPHAVPGPRWPATNLLSSAPMTVVGGLGLVTSIGSSVTLENLGGFRNRVFGRIPTRETISAIGGRGGKERKEQSNCYRSASAMVVGDLALPKSINSSVTLERLECMEQVFLTVSVNSKRKRKQRPSCGKKWQRRGRAVKIIFGYWTKRKLKAKRELGLCTLVSPHLWEEHQYAVVDDLHPGRQAGGHWKF